MAHAIQSSGENKLRRSHGWMAPRNSLWSVVAVATTTSTSQQRSLLSRWQTRRQDGLGHDDERW